MPTIAATQAAIQASKKRHAWRAKSRTVQVESVTSIEHDKASKTRTLHTLRGLWPILLQPRYMVFPLDHRREFKGAVGACRGPAGLKATVSHSVDQWVIVGTLSLGVIAGFLGYVLAAPPEERSIYDQLLIICCILEALFAFTGPVVLGSVLSITSSSCSDENYDLFVEAAHSAFLWFEVNTVLMSYMLTGIIMLLTPVMLGNRDVLPPRLEILESHGASLTIMALLLPWVAWTVVQINVASSLVFNGMLIADNRASRIKPWDFRDKTTRTHERVVDEIVRTALHYRQPGAALRRYSALRVLGASKGGKMAESVLRKLHLRATGRVSRLRRVKSSMKGDRAVEEEAAAIIQEWFQKRKERRLEEKLFELSSPARALRKVGQAAKYSVSSARLSSDLG